MTPERVEAKEVRKMGIVKCALGILNRNGLENTTTRQVCKDCKINQNTLYYYFGSKDNLVIQCYLLASSEVEYAILNNAIADNNTLEGILNGIVSKMDSYEENLRVIEQVTGSPIYSKMIKDLNKSINERYDIYGKKIAENCGYDYEEKRVQINLFLSVIMCALHYRDTTLLEEEVQALKKLF